MVSDELAEKYKSYYIYIYINNGWSIQSSVQTLFPQSKTVSKYLEEVKKRGRDDYRVRWRKKKGESWRNRKRSWTSSSAVAGIFSKAYCNRQTGPHSLSPPHAAQLWTSAQANHSYVNQDFPKALSSKTLSFTLQSSRPLNFNSWMRLFCNSPRRHLHPLLTMFVSFSRYFRES